MRQIALDTETTGLLCYDGHRIIELGCVELIDRKITGKIFHSYLNPNRKIDPIAKDITGLNENFLQSKPEFSHIVNDFFDFIDKSDELIIHNAIFDINFINNELHLVNFKINDIRKHFKIFDTLTFSRKKHPGKKNNLDALCRRYNIDNRERSVHGALIDAELLAKVYLAMTSNQNELGYIRDFNVTNIFCDLHVETLKANVQDVKKHVAFLRDIKQHVL
ncbi:MAG TPA: DNA polymerase III subunit epsilon [Candidatus Azoamicus sp. OHIO2]